MIPRLLRHATRRQVKLIAKGAAAGTLVLGVAYYWPEVSFGARATVRVARSVTTVALIAARYKWSLNRYWSASEYRLLTAQEQADFEEAKHKVHQSAAKWLLWLFQLNGGIYIKLGQHLATLDFILPSEYTQTLSVLFNKAPTSTPAEVERVIKEELGGEMSTYFSEFEWPPIGAASLAQVHRARLQGSNELVAVKIQHKRLQGFADVDIVTAAVLVKAIRMVFPHFEFSWLADELKLNLPRELNFELEGHNAERTSRNFRKSGLFTVPKVHWKLTRKRLLTMEYCDGFRITDVNNLKQAGVDLHKVSDRLTKAYSEMIFLHGFVHCDPHPGNILVTVKPESGFNLVLLDHGLYRDIPDDFRLHYARLWRALVNGDEKGIANASFALGGGDAHRLFSSILTHRSWDRISMRSLDQPRTLAEIEAIRSKFPEYFQRVAHLLASVPRPLLLLLKTNDLLRCIDRTLLSDNSSSRSFLIMARYCAYALYEDQLQNSGLFGMVNASIFYALAVIKYRMAEWLIGLNNFMLKLSNRGQ